MKTISDPTKNQTQLILIDGIRSRTEADLISAHKAITQCANPADREVATEKYYRAYDTLILIFNYSLDDLQRLIGDAA
jgi:hypothetical protein